MLKNESHKYVAGIFDKYESVLDDLNAILTVGSVEKISGLLIECRGPMAKIGDICYIHLPNGSIARSEIIGFDGQYVQMLAMESINGIIPGCKVHSYGRPLEINVGQELIGRVMDCFGNPIDSESFFSFFNERIAVHKSPPNPLERKKIDSPIQTGIKAIDGLLTTGLGQRMGVFSGTGVGKSTVMSMIARDTNADLNVVCLVGERGREVKEFIERDLGEEGLERSIIVVATADAPALTRVRSLYTATAIAEYFRDQGMNVMFMADSVTRFAMAQREIGALLGEPPTVKGYSPSVFARLSNVLERTGTSKKGSITAFYTVLVEGDDMEDDPIADSVRGILDGHIVLSRQLAFKNHYPAIDISKSISRLMPYIVEKDQYLAASKIKEWIAHYDSIQELLNVGAYVKGENLVADEAIAKIEQINEFLRQSLFDTADIESTKDKVMELAFNTKADTILSGTPRAPLSNLSNVLKS